MREAALFQVCVPDSHGGGRFPGMSRKPGRRWLPGGGAYHSEDDLLVPGTHLDIYLHTSASGDSAECFSSEPSSYRSPHSLSLL